jgi:RimJ/RimL family protein N-acetyltransferase
VVSHQVLVVTTHNDQEETMNKTESSMDLSGGFYRLVVRERIDAHWAAYLGDLTLRASSMGGTILEGALQDQAACYGLISRLRDLGLTLLEVQRLAAPDSMVKVLETERLLLRRLMPEDLDALFVLYSDTELRQYFPEGALTYEETREELEWFLHGHPLRPELGLWATIHKATGHFIGRCGLLPWKIDDQPEVEIAYLLDKRFWGQGFATEAAQGIMQYGFTQLRLPRLISLIDVRNQASIAVARRIGMQLEQTREDEKGRYFLFAIACPT